MDKEFYLSVYRHSLAHVLAKAVIELYGPETQYAIGPQIADGFYYDFRLPVSVKEEDFPKIEARMKEILKRREPWTRLEVTRAEALELFKGQKYKTELIQDLPEDEVITIYRTGDDFVDLCRGPHIDNSQELMNAAFEIRAVSGAYWRGDEHNDALQRIYVWAFPTRDELKAHKALIKEALERDHKKIGAQLDLFMFDETAPGMAYWLPRGWRMYQALLAYSRSIQERHGYTEISAPLINKKKLWLISGHWAHYQNNMFLVPGVSGSLAADAEIPGVLSNPQDGLDEAATVKLPAGSPLFNVEQDDTMGAKPMNCPNAMMTYKRTMHSYRELPIRYSEYDVLHRKEKSGQLNGLFRVQEFRQDDDHTFVMESQIEDDIVFNDATADEIYSTFGLTYATREGGIEMPVVIHRAIYGSLERFIGIIIEHFKGNFPFWMSPEQVAIVPIRTEHNDYAREIEDHLLDLGIRVEADYADQNMNTKIKNFKTMKDPYIIVVGDKERDERTVSITVRGQKQQLHGVPLEKFYEMCLKMNREHSRDLISSVE